MEDRKKLELAITFIVLVLLVTMVFVHFAEGWSWVDSFYFSGVTMATVGYGDLTPHHPATKIFITFDILFSVGLFLYSISIVAEMRVKNAAKWNVPVEALPKHLNQAVRRLQTVRHAEKLSPHKRRLHEIFAPSEERRWLEKDRKAVPPREDKYVPLKVPKENAGMHEMNQMSSQKDAWKQGASKERQPKQGASKQSMARGMDFGGGRR